METIYSANLLQVFGWRLLLALLILVGGVGFAWQQWRGNNSSRKDKGWGCLLLVGATLVSLYLMGLTAVSFVRGARSLTAELTIKRLVTDDDGSNYNIDFAQVQTDFDVPKRVYDLVEEGQCYQVRYFHDYLAEYNPITLLSGEVYPYESSAFVAEIARPAEPGACQ